MKETSRKKYLLYFLIIINLFLLYSTRPSITENYNEMRSENDRLKKEIAGFETKDDKTIKETSYFKSDKEFIDEVNSLLLDIELSDYKLSFLESDISGNDIESEALLEIKGKEKDLIKLLGKLWENKRMEIKSVDIKAEQKNISSNLILKFYSNFNNYFKSEEDLVNKSPFKDTEMEVNLEKKIIENKEDSKVEVKAKNKKEEISNTLDSKKDKEKTLNAKDKVEPKKNIVNQITNNYKIGDINFIEKDYEYIKKLDEDLYIYSFSSNKKEIKYIGDSIAIDKAEGGKILVQYWINGTIDNIKPGLDIEYMDRKIRNKKIFFDEIIEEGWNHINFIIENKEVKSIRLLIGLPKEKLRGSILIDKFNIRELDSYE